MKDNLQLRDSSGFAPDSLLITSQVNQSCNRLQRYNKKRIPQKITCFLFGITYYLPHIFNNSPPLHGWGWGGVSVFYPYIILFIFFSLISPTPPLSPPLHGWGTAWKQTLSGTNGRWSKGKSNRQKRNLSEYCPNAGITAKI